MKLAYAWWRLRFVGLSVTLRALPEGLESFLRLLAIIFALCALVDGYVLRNARLLGTVTILHMLIGLM